MRGLSAATANLAKLKRQWEEMAGAAGLAGTAGMSSSLDAAPRPLRQVHGFGSNPGDLAMFVHVPDALPPRPALVVVLHGCTQSAAAYEHGAGWSSLADRHGFILVYPEQKAANNQKGCFNWFVPEDVTRDRGEALSIRQMVAHAVLSHGVDPGRIFVTGLSAGGAMAAAMLATYPDVFAGGAVIAGLPYGVARNVQGALEHMFKGRPRAPRELGDLVRGASSHRGPWPRLSVWHGSADAVVVPSNADELVKQWRDLHGLDATVQERDRIDGHDRTVWRGPDGRPLVESVTVAGLGHGTALATGDGPQHAGRPGPYMLEAGISSSHHIVSFWGLSDGVPLARAPAHPPATRATIVSPDGTIHPPEGHAAPRRVRAPRHAAATAEIQPGQPGGEALMRDVGQVIAKALRAAGLQRP